MPTWQADSGAHVSDIGASSPPFWSTYMLILPLLPIQLPANVHLTEGRGSRGWLMYVGPCHPPWEAQMEFLTPRFGLDQSWML